MRLRVEALIQLRTESEDRPPLYLVERMLDSRYPKNLGKYRCIGGAVEPGESEQDALVRELRKEYGIRILARQLRMIYSLIGLHQEARRYIVEGEVDAKPHTRSAEGTEELAVVPRAPEPWIGEDQDDDAVLLIKL